MSAAAIVVAAGRGTRLGADLPKAFVEINGWPMLVWATRAFSQVDEAGQIILVIPPGWEEKTAQALARADLTARVTDIVTGGEKRPASVRAGLYAVHPDVEVIAIHDAARPLVTPDLIRRCLAAAHEQGSALACAASIDTLKRVDGDRGVVLGTLDRRDIWQAQTPQVFRHDVIMRAYSCCGGAVGDGVTDDCMLCEALGIEPAVVECLRSNMKVTTPEDLLVAEALLKAREAEQTQ